MMLIYFILTLLPFTLADTRLWVSSSHPSRGLLINSLYGTTLYYWSDNLRSSNPKFYSLTEEKLEGVPAYYTCLDNRQQIVDITESKNGVTLTNTDGEKVHLSLQHEVPKEINALTSYDMPYIYFAVADLENIPDRVFVFSYGRNMPNNGIVEFKKTEYGYTYIQTFRPKRLPKSGPITIDTKYGEFTLHNKGFFRSQEVTRDGVPLQWISITSPENTDLMAALFRAQGLAYPLPCPFMGLFWSLQQVDVIVDYLYRNEDLIYAVVKDELVTLFEGVAVKNVQFAQVKTSLNGVIHIKGGNVEIWDLSGEKTGFVHVGNEIVEKVERSNALFELAQITLNDFYTKKKEKFT